MVFVFVFILSISRWHAAESEVYFAWVYCFDKIKERKEDNKKTEKKNSKSNEVTNSECVKCERYEKRNEENYNKLNNRAEYEYEYCNKRF